jgi:membrane protein YdbS with pleckstrin-like domain
MDSGAKRTDLEKAKLLYNQGHLSESKAILNDLSLHKETGGSANYLLALIELKENNFGQSLKHLKVSLNINPNYDNAHYYIGLIYEKLGQPADANFYYKKTLEINPTHEAALKKIQSHSPINISNENTHPTTDFFGGLANSKLPSDFYQLLLEDTSPVAKKVVLLINKLNFSVTPSLTSHYGHILKIFFILLRNAVVLTAFAGFFIFVIYNLFFHQNTSNPWPSRSGFQAPDFLTLTSALIVIFLIIITGVFFKLWEITSKKYVFTKGKLMVYTGGFNRKLATIELYRIMEVEMTQDFIQQKTNDGTLILKYNSRSEISQVELPGVAKGQTLIELVDELREVIILLRAIPWIKGIIS